MFYELRVCEAWIITIQAAAKCPKAKWCRHLATQSIFTDLLPT